MLFNPETFIAFDFWQATTVRDGECRSLGGGLMGVGAKFARGCTSGQALSGAAVLNLGSWAFMLCVFIGAYALAYFVRKEWT